MLISRLNARKYPWSNPANYLKIPSTTGSALDPVFAGRLAAFARANRKVITCTSSGGRRDIPTQIRLYNTLPAGQAARPGTSFHELGLAWDTADAWLRSLHAILATANQTELLRYGLCKPLTRGNNASVLEPWHIQPIETWRVALKERQRLAPLEFDLEVRLFQQIYGMVADNLYGPTSMGNAQIIFLGGLITT